MPESKYPETFFRWYLRDLIEWFRQGNYLGFEEVKIIKRWAIWKDKKADFEIDIRYEWNFI